MPKHFSSAHPVPTISKIDKVEATQEGMEGIVEFREEGWSGIEKVEFAVIIALASLLLYLVVN